MEINSSNQLSSLGVGILVSQHTEIIFMYMQEQFQGSAFNVLFPLNWI